MKVLRSNIKYFRELGLLLEPGQHGSTISDILYNCLVILPIFLILIWSGMYTYVYIVDVLEMTFGLYVVSAVAIYFTSYWIFALRRQKFMAIIDELQAIVASSEIY